MTDSSRLIDRIQLLNQQRLGNVKGAHEDLLVAIRELKYEVQLPWDTLWETRFQMLHSVCKRMAIEMGLVKAIANRSGAALSAEELSAGTKLDPRVIGRQVTDEMGPGLTTSCSTERVLRLLANIRLISDVGENRFKATEVTKLLNSPGNTAWDKVFYDFVFPIGANIVNCIRETGLPQFPGDEEKGPFDFTFGVRFYEYLAQQSRVKHDYDLAMSARRDGLLPQWFQIYPVMAKLDDEVVTQGKNIIVDVAGNKGYDLISFATEYPKFEGTMILEDLPTTFAQLNGEERSKIKSAGIEMQEYNFFTPQPIKGANFYFIRDVLHDWPDQAAVQLLSQTAGAMEPGRSRLLIEDHVVEVKDLHYTPAAADILLMLIHNGIERTLEQWKVLLKDSGLRIVEVWPNGAGHQSIVEACRI